MANQDTPHTRDTKRLLVIDDDQSVREMLVRVLHSDGYFAWPAADGKQAQAIMATTPIDLVLLDLGLPGKDGWETFETLLHQDPRLAVIIITARANQRIIAESVGANALFEKPLDFPELLRTVARLLAEPARPRRGTDHATNLTAAAPRGPGPR
jgi:DNA-binding response OmpR family regulator